MTLSLLIIGLITGTMIGALGVGGVLLAPFLFYGMGFDLHDATALASWSFFFTGIVGTITYWRMGSISWNVVGWLTIGIIPAAILGTRTNLALPNAYLIPTLAILILASGINTLFSKSQGKRALSTFGWKILILLGVVTGFVSALTGTGGPVVLVPVLMFLNVPVLAAIAVSQVVQVPIAAAAKFGIDLYGQTDLTLGTMLGVVQAFGVLAGARIARSFRPKQLRNIVAIALIITAIIMISRLLFP